MSEDMVDVTIHIDETIDSEQRTGIADRLRATNGVMAASSHESQPHLMVVEYDPAIIDSQQILDAVLATGVHAQLIGM